MSTLIEALQTADMLEIDGLHAWQFELQAAPADAAEPALWIECMDGRTRRQWHFSLEQVNLATYEPQTDIWKIDSATAQHVLKCFAAFCGDNLDDDSEQAPV